MLATVTAPAGGAPTTQLIIATAMGAVVTLALLAILHGHRTGRLGIIGFAGRIGERLTGLPAWSALPAGLAIVSFASAGFGVWWDIALHIDQGRDAGPLANPAHYFILAGIYGFASAGVLALVLHSEDRPSPYAIKPPGLPRLPVGGALLFACGSFSLIGFPLDDMWHRLFGQDVTLWGPTHVQMICGALVGIVAVIALLVEGQRAAGMELDGPASTYLLGVARWALPGVVLIGISLQITEFDWGVPQYRQVWQPLLLAGAAAFALIWARLWAGRLGAVRALGLYLVARGVLHLLVGTLGEVEPVLPLFVAEAATVTLLGLVMDARARPLRFGALAGLAVGAASFAASYWASQWQFRLPWHESLLAEGIPSALIAGAGAGVLGALAALAMRGVLPTRPVARPAAILAGVALLAVAVNAGASSSADGLRAQIDVTRVAGGQAQIAARFNDEARVRDANWLYAIAWQGGGIRTEALKRGADGVWRTAKPVPFDGDWKTALRLHDGRMLEAIPLHHPADTAIGLKAYSAPAHGSAAFVDEIRVLQAERRDDTPTWLWSVASTIVFSLVLLFLVATGLGIARIGRPEVAPPGEPLVRPRAPRRLLAPTPS
jgi:hypothetical protein